MSSNRPPGLPGIDVSKWQGDVDFQKVAAAGERYVFCRACYGTGADSRIADYWPKVKAAGLPRGAYHYLVAGDDGAAQAEAFLKVFDGAGMAYGPGDLPPAADVEDQKALASDATKKQFVDALRTWVDTVGQKLGTTPIVYTGTYFWGELGNPSGFEHCPLWIARYNDSVGSVPPGWSSWTFWQHSGSGTVDGIAGDVDLDVFQGDDAAFKKLLIAG
jgi:lysozyme